MRLAILAAPWELKPDERGKTYLVTEPWIAQGPKPWQRLAIKIGDENDGYTFAPNLPDKKPAEAHDKAYKTHCWDNGKRMQRWEADWMLRHYMEISWCPITRFMVKIYCPWVEGRVGWLFWYLGELRLFCKALNSALGA